MSAGTFSVVGLDPAGDGSRIRAQLGVVPLRDRHDEELTVREDLIISGRCSRSRTIMAR